jgi:hypothetical protein
MASSTNPRWVLSADVSNAGSRRLSVYEEGVGADGRPTRRRTVDSQALEHIFGACASAAVRDVEATLALLDGRGRDGEGAVDPADAPSLILLRCAVLSDALRRERQGGAILEAALASSLAALEAARAELVDVRSERDALASALAMRR